MTSRIAHLFIYCCFYGDLISLVLGHGRLLEPPSRASMWRLGFPNPRNYNDNQNFCGGQTTQHEIHGGRCGVCGDEYTDSGEGEHVAGGTYANGIIGRTYQVGQVIDVIAEITANHLGWMEFHICPNNNPEKKATEECMQPLIPVGSTSGSIIPVTAQMVGPLYLKLQLPPDLKCVQCVVRWKYIAGNSWGVDKATGKQCQGCGNQENFYSCADITIGGDKPWWDSVQGLRPLTTTLAPDWIRLAQEQQQQLQLQQQQWGSAEQQQQQQQSVGDYDNNQVDAKAWADNTIHNAEGDWGANNWAKYAHLYNTQPEEVVTLPTTTKPSDTNSLTGLEVNGAKLGPPAAAVENGVPVVTGFAGVFDHSKVSTAAPTEAPEPPPQPSPKPVWKTLADFNLGESLLISKKVVKNTTEPVTLRPMREMGNFDFSSLKGGVTPASVIINVASTTPKPKKIVRKIQQKSLAHSVIKGDLSWADLVKMMKEKESTTAFPTTTTTTTPPSPINMVTTTRSPNFQTTTIARKAKPLEIDVYHREQFSSRLSNGDTYLPASFDPFLHRDRDSGQSASSIPYVSSIVKPISGSSSRSLPSSIANIKNVALMDRELMSEAGEDLADDNCTVLVIGEENGEPTYLAVCDDNRKK